MAKVSGVLGAGLVAWALTATAAFVAHSSAIILIAFIKLYS